RFRQVLAGAREVVPVGHDVRARGGRGRWARRDGRRAVGLRGPAPTAATARAKACDERGHERSGETKAHRNLSPAGSGADDGTARDAWHGVVARRHKPMDRIWFDGSERHSSKSPNARRARSVGCRTEALAESA